MPQEPGYVPYQPTEARVIHRRAENGEVVAYTAEEYGVHNDGLGIIEPVNSSGGLLFLAILLSAGMGGLAYFVVQVIIQDVWDIAGRVWWVFPACICPFVFAWASYFSERNAEKLRAARTLPRPATCHGPLNSVHGLEESRGQA
ncbi:hypothetical protein [Arthrobacter sp. PsM3]|uniref:hypothetical protein n=1 Tax=Arthrobacter sp. PsM3 TaxID=3030531 RepID=UPI00263A4A77|nr:hypothetical protein [Arthrobacter sp. PsM3]MDN4643642.1 hypothetical protein [Arthrobacter sp. PsM3]